MTALLVFNLVWAAVVTALAALPTFGGISSPYEPAVPFVAQATAAMLAALAGLALRRWRLFWMLLSNALLGTLYWPWSCAMRPWPGGDDGGGMNWFFVVGLATGLSLLAAMSTSIACMVYAARKRP